MRRVEKKTGRIGVAHPRPPIVLDLRKGSRLRRHHTHCSTTTEMNCDPIQHGISKYMVCKLMKTEPINGQSVEATGGVYKRQGRSQPDLMTRTYQESSFCPGLTTAILCLHHVLDDNSSAKCSR